MNIKDIKANPTFKGDIECTFTLDKSENKAVQELLQIDKASLPKYDLRVVKAYKKRSLDANAYAWSLINKLAEKLNSTSEEVYKECIRRYGVRTIILVKNEVLENVTAMFSQMGTGNSYEVLNKSANNPNGTNVQLFFGSSKYNTKQMARLIDGIVSECKDMGIETLTPDELLELKERWHSVDKTT